MDRDGIINRDLGYVYRIEDFQFNDGIFDLARLFQEAGYLLIVVTNQSGIGRGFYTLAQFQTLTEWMQAQFLAQQTPIAQVYFCPHHPNEQCHCRKPDIGMVEQAVQDYSIDLSVSWMIGDKASDIELAKNAGIAHSIYIGESTASGAQMTFDSVRECADYFLEHKII